MVRGQAYFYSNFVAYILGLVTTVVFMVWFKAAQVRPPPAVQGRPGPATPPALIPYHWRFKAAQVRPLPGLFPIKRRRFRAAQALPPPPPSTLCPLSPRPPPLWPPAPPRHSRCD